MINRPFEVWSDYWCSSARWHEIKATLWFWASWAHHIIRFGSFKVIISIIQENFLLLCSKWIWNTCSLHVPLFSLKSYWRAQFEWALVHADSPSVTGMHLSFNYSELQEPYTESQGNWFETQGSLLFYSGSISHKSLQKTRWIKSYLLQVLTNIICMFLKVFTLRPRKVFIISISLF